MPQGTAAGERITWDDAKEKRLLLAIVGHTKPEKINWTSVAEMFGTGLTSEAAKQKFGKIKKRETDLFTGSGATASTAGSKRARTKKVAPTEKEGEKEASDDEEGGSDYQLPAQKAAKKVKVEDDVELPRAGILTAAIDKPLAPGVPNVHPHNFLPLQDKMPTDKQNVEFLYSVIKQLEVKHIQWQSIADSNNIPNGHAARMRFHRLRQAMDGTAPKPRVPKEDSKADVKKPPRKAKEAADAKVKRKIAQLEEGSEDDEIPLRNVHRRKRRIKVEEEGDSDEYRDESGKVKKEEDVEDVKPKLEDLDGQESGVRIKGEPEGDATFDGASASAGEQQQGDQEMDD